jgi:predicted TPR repeat methyltransferase
LVEQATPDWLASFLQGLFARHANVFQQSLVEILQYAALPCLFELK